MQRLMTRDGWLDWERKEDDILFCAYGEKAHKAMHDFNRIKREWEAKGQKTANILEECLTNAQQFITTL
jgi:hypothetical protein